MKSVAHLDPDVGQEDSERITVKLSKCVRAWLDLQYSHWEIFN